MNRLLILSILLCGMVCSGCEVLGKKNKEESITLDTPTFAQNDYRNFAEEDDEHQYMRHLSRGDRPVEKDPDTWYRKYFMSSKARSIERNVGIE